MECMSLLLTITCPCLAACLVCQTFPWQQYISETTTHGFLLHEHLNSGLWSRGTLQSCWIRSGEAPHIRLWRVYDRQSYFGPSPACWWWSWRWSVAVLRNKPFWMPRCTSRNILLARASLASREVGRCVLLRTYYHQEGKHDIHLARFDITYVPFEGIN